jgi:hypothetical protein
MKHPSWSANANGRERDLGHHPGNGTSSAAAGSSMMASAEPRIEPLSASSYRVGNLCLHCASHKALRRELPMRPRSRAPSEAIASGGRERRDERQDARSLRNAWNEGTQGGATPQIPSNEGFKPP